MRLPLGYCLRDGLHFCIADRHAIFLDLKADRYFRLSDDLGALFCALAAKSDAPIPVQDLAMLCERRLIVPAAGTGLIGPASVLCASTAFDDGDGTSANAADVAIALLHEFRAAYLLKLLTLSKVIDGVARIQPTICAPPNSLARTVAAFESANRFISRHGRCLVKSIALATRLKLIGHSCQLVLGVQARPFSAHAWVQSGDFVLNDVPDHIRAFTPILAV